MFTDRTRLVLARAHAEAVRLHHGYVGTEHLLLALCQERGGEGVRVLSALGLDLQQLRERVEAACVDVRKGPTVAVGTLPYTARAERALDLAAAESRDVAGRPSVGTSDLLIGLLLENHGVAAQVLKGFGVTPDAARAAMGRVPAAPEAPSAPQRSSAAHLRIELDDTSDRSIYEQIIAATQEAVATGTIKPGERLPTVRQLADELDIAPGTVARSYSELERLNVIVTEGARGTRVAPLERPSAPISDRPQTLVGLLRPVAVAAFHLGGSAAELRKALEEAMKDIFGSSDAA